MWSSALGVAECIYYQDRSRMSQTVGPFNTTNQFSFENATWCAFLPTFHAKTMGDGYNSWLK